MHPGNAPFLAEILVALKELYARQGQLGRAIGYMHESWAVRAPALGPFQEAQNRSQEVGLYAAAGQADRALDSGSGGFPLLPDAASLLPSRVQVAAAPTRPEADDVRKVRRVKLDMVSSCSKRLLKCQTSRTMAFHTCLACQQSWNSDV